jgi:hypothetical protein
VPPGRRRWRPREGPVHHRPPLDRVVAPDLSAAGRQQSRQGRIRPERLEERQGPFQRGHGLLTAGLVPVDGAQPAVVETLPSDVAELVPQLDGTLVRLGRPRPVVEESGLLRHGVVQLGEGTRILRWEAQRTFVLGRGLAVRAEVCRASGRAGCESGDQLGVAGPLCVVGQPGLVVAPVRGQDGQQGPVTRRPTVGPDLGLDGAAGQLVPEAQGEPIAAQETGHHELLEARRRYVACPGQQTRIDAPRVQGSQVECRSRVLGQPGGSGQDCVAGRDGHARALACDQLGHEERVPARERVHLRGRVRRALGQAPDPGGRERWQVDPPGAALAGELAQCQSEPVIGCEGIVAEGHEQQDRQLGDPATEEAEQVQRRLVRPLHVFDHQHPEVGDRGRRLQHRVEDLVARRRRPYGVQQRAAELSRHVVHRTQRSRREQAVAQAPRPRGVDQPALQLFDQRGLAHSRLTGDQDEPARADPRLFGVLQQRAHLRLTLDQRHVDLLGAPGHHVGFRRLMGGSPANAL